MERQEIASLLKQRPIGQQITVCGWIRTFRNDRFIALNDGSTINNIQVVIDASEHSDTLVKELNTGAAIQVAGEVVESQGKEQSIEIQGKSLTLLGGSDPDEYPLQPKRHSLEFLREKGHLRMRTSTFSAVFRIRHAASYAIHRYFNDNGFYMMHTPIITGSDAEGAGEMFRVTTLDLKDTPLTDDGAVDVKEDFFGKVFR